MPRRVSIPPTLASGPCSSKLNEAKAELGIGWGKRGAQREIAAPRARFVRVKPRQARCYRLNEIGTALLVKAISLPTGNRWMRTYAW